MNSIDSNEQKINSVLTFKRLEKLNPSQHLREISPVTFFTLPFHLYLAFRTRIFEHLC